MRKYELSKHRLYVPIINSIDIGIDDAGIRRENILGWSAVVLDEFSTEKLNQEHQRLHEKYGLREFHGSDFRNTITQRAAYSDFFETIYGLMSKSNISYIKFFLTSPDKYDSRLELIEKNFVKLAENISAKMSLQRKIPESFRESAKFLIPPFDELVSKINIFQSDYNLRIFIDETKNISKLLNEKIMLYKLFLPNKDWIIMAIKKLYQIKDKRLFKISSNSIIAVDSKKYPIVQAADVIGNFGLNFIRHVLLGKPKDKSNRSVKYEIFKDTLLEKTSDIKNIEKNFKNKFYISNSQKICSIGKPKVSLLEIFQEKNNK